MHEWMMLRAGLLLLALGVFVAAAFIAGGRSRRRDGAATIRNRRVLHQDAGMPALR